MPAQRILLEVAAASVDDACLAQSAGADRLELSSALPLGGLTPSLATVEAVRQAVEIPVAVLIRPRVGGFHYGDREFAIMCRDVELALAAGANGIVFGILTANGEVDVPRCAAIRKVIGGKEAIFHRAFDVVPDPLRALEQLIDLGCTRILTSGQEATAVQGARLIAALRERAAGRIEILPGSGIRAATVRTVIDMTGCAQVHASLRTGAKDNSTALRPHVKFGSRSLDEAIYDVTDGEAVRAVRQILDELELAA